MHKNVFAALGINSIKTAQLQGAESYTVTDVASLIVHSQLSGLTPERPSSSSTRAAKSGIEARKELINVSVRIYPASFTRKMTFGAWLHKA